MWTKLAPRVILLKLTTHFNPTRHQVEGMKKVVILSHVSNWPPLRPYKAIHWICERSWHLESFCQNLPPTSTLQDTRLKVGRKLSFWVMFQADHPIDPTKRYTEYVNEVGISSHFLKLTTQFDPTRHQVEGRKKICIWCHFWNLLSPAFATQPL